MFLTLTSFKLTLLIYGTIFHVNKSQDTEFAKSFVILEESLGAVQIWIKKRYMLLIWLAIQLVSLCCNLRKTLSWVLIHTPYFSRWLCYVLCFVLYFFVLEFLILSFLIGLFCVQLLILPISVLTGGLDESVRVYFTFLSFFFLVEKDKFVFLCLCVRPGSRIYSKFPVRRTSSNTFLGCFI